MKSLKMITTVFVAAYLTIGTLHFANSQADSNAAAEAFHTAQKATPTAALSNRAPASVSSAPIICKFETPSAIKAVGKGETMTQALDAAASDCFDKGQNNWITKNRIPIDVTTQEAIVLECANHTHCG